MISTETFNTLQGFPGPLLIFSPLFLVVLGFLVLFVNSLKAGLSHVPGPFLARYTDAWNLWCAWKITKYGGKNEHFRQLQAKYGDTVRIGPQSVLVLDPAAVPVVYGVRAKLDKGPAYLPFRQPGVTTSLMSIQDEKKHAQYRKLVSNAYSMSSLKGYEPYVDDIVNRFLEVCIEHARSEEPMNISLWCHYYCYDVVSKVTLGESLGFMSGAGRDAHSLIKSVKAFGWYVAIVSQMPWLHKVFQDNILFRRTKPSPFMGVVHGRAQDRLRNAKEDPENQQPRPDLLSHFVATHKNQPLMDQKQVSIMASGNLIAGGLSPGTTVDCLCQYLASHPVAQDKLFAELVQAQCTSPAAFDDVKDLPYLEGIIREAYRIHATASFNLQRVTGPNGLELPRGIRLPAGTRVGCPAEAINKDARVWGVDPGAYKPERWMKGVQESEETYHDRRTMWDRTELTFGQGSRTCIGKNITQLEIYKVVATLMLNFKFELLGEPKSREVFVRVHLRDKASF